MQKTHNKSYSVVIPMYNEVDNVAPLLQEVQQAVEHLNSEIIIVDDGSNDGTYEKLCELKKQIKALHIVRHAGNFGQSAGVVSGVNAASKEWIITLDGDGQNDPADIHKFIDKLIEVESSPEDNNRPVLMIGQRKERQDNWVRRLSTRTANAVRGWLLKDNCPDSGCGIKLFHRQTFLTLPHFNHCHRFLPALFTRAGAIIINVPVNHRPRLRGQSKYGVMNRLWVGIVDLFGVAWLMRRSCHPIINENTTG